MTNQMLAATVMMRAGSGEIIIWRLDEGEKQWRSLAQFTFVLQEASWMQIMLSILCICTVINMMPWMWLSMHRDYFKSF